MNCPYCNHDETKVVDSREAKDGSTIKRRRECLLCIKRFTTIEKTLKLDLEVKKTNGEVEEFNYQKIKRGLIRACEKRPVTLEQIDHLLEAVLKEIKKIQKSPIPTKDVGKVVLRKLKSVDEIAFLRFAIVHNKYGNLNEFIEELDQLKKLRKKSI